MKHTITAFIGDEENEIYMSCNVDVTIEPSDKEEFGGTMVDVGSGTISLDEINYVELVSFGIGIDITDAIKNKFNKDAVYKNNLTEEIVEFINDNDIEEISK